MVKATEQIDHKIAMAGRKTDLRYGVGSCSLPSPVGWYCRELGSYPGYDDEKSQIILQKGGADEQNDEDEKVGIRGPLEYSAKVPVGFIESLESIHKVGDRLANTLDRLYLFLVNNERSPSLNVHH